MLGQEDHAPESGPDTDDRHQPAAVVPAPRGMTPICDEERFAALLENVVADEAPRLFAVVQEYGERVNFWIAAWGMAFDDHAEVVRVDRRLRMNLQAPENALRFFTRADDIRARLVWFNPDATTPEEDDEVA